MVGKLTNVKYRELSPVTVIVTLIPQGWLEGYYHLCELCRFERIRHRKGTPGLFY